MSSSEQLRAAHFGGYELLDRPYVHVLLKLGVALIIIPRMVMCSYIIYKYEAVIY